MTKNLYYRAVYKRQNHMKDNFKNFIIVLASLPRLVLEVFLRRNMGRRYFKFSSSVILVAILFILPFLYHPYYRSFYPDMVTSDNVFSGNWLYFLFLVVFCVFSYFRHKEVKRVTSEFDMFHFSMSNGDPLPFFRNLKFNGKPVSIRTIEVILEPLSFIFLSFVPLFLGEFTLAMILFNSAILYSISSLLLYRMGDNFIMDKIDEIICNEDLSNDFINDERGDKGFRCTTKKPRSKQLREKIFNGMIEKERISDAI